MTPDTFFQAIAAITLVTGFAISAYFRRKAARASGERISRREEGVLILVLLRIAGLTMWLSAIAYAINPKWLAWSAFFIPIELRWLGAGLSVAAVPLIAWMFRSLGDNVTDTVAVRHRHVLVTRGPYRWIRHPLYSFGFLLFAGINLMAANGLMALSSLLGFALLVIRTLIEEAKLIEKFGDEYRAYMQRTGRFLPRLAR